MKDLTIEIKDQNRDNTDSKDSQDSQDSTVNQEITDKDNQGTTDSQERWEKVGTTETTDKGIEKETQERGETTEGIVDKDKGKNHSTCENTGEVTLPMGLTHQPTVIAFL